MSPLLLLRLAMLLANELEDALGVAWPLPLPAEPPLVILVMVKPEALRLLKLGRRLELGVEPGLELVC